MAYGQWFGQDRQRGKSRYVSPRNAHSAGLASSGHHAADAPAADPDDLGRVARIGTTRAGANDGWRWEPS